MFPSLDWAFQLRIGRYPDLRASAPIPSAVTRIEWGTRGNLEDQFLFFFVNLNHSHSLLEIHQRWFRSHHCSSVSFLS